MAGTPEGQKPTGFSNGSSDEPARAEDRLNSMMSRLDALEQPLYRRRNVLGGIIAVLLFCAGYTVANILDNGHLAAAVHSALGTDLALEKILKDSGQTRFGDAVDSRIQRTVDSSRGRSRLVFASAGHFHGRGQSVVDADCMRRGIAMTSSSRQSASQSNYTGYERYISEIDEIEEACAEPVDAEPESITIPLLVKCGDKITVRIFGYTPTQYAHANHGNEDVIARDMKGDELKKYISLYFSEIDVSRHVEGARETNGIWIEKEYSNGSCKQETDKLIIEDIAISASQLWRDRKGPEIAVRVFVLVNWDSNPN